VLDALFPIDSGNFRDVRKEASLVLRFTPSFAAEMQINIIKYSDNRDIEAVMYTLPKGSKSIWEQVDEMRQRNERENARRMARAIVVEKQVISDKDELRKLLQQLASLSIPTQLNPAMTLDGTRFEFWYETTSNKYYYSLVGGEPGEDSQAHPIVKWMNQVRQSFVR
jgi:hypothetical protein